MKRIVMAGAIVVGAVSACTDATGLRGERVSLTFQVPRPGSRNAGGEAALQAAGDPITITRTLRLDRVQVRFTRVDLQRADQLDDRDTDLNGDDGEDIDVDSDQRNNVVLRGPFTVDLPLQGGVITPVMVDIPFGVYDEVKLRVSNLVLCGAYDANGDGDFTDPSEEFTGALNRPCVDVPIREKFELRLNPPLVVDQTTDPLNITVTFDPSAWLLDRNGSVIDPRRLATDGRLRAQFRARIRNALRALEDGNRNGRDDRDTDRD
jgi:hypothetical protein